MKEVTIGGETRRIGEFSAFKAFKAGDLVSALEGVWRRCLSEAAKFKREYESENVTEMDRAEARRLFAPRQLFDTKTVERDGEIVTTPEGEIAYERVPLRDGEGRPVMGPDPLGHLTDADWEANGQKLRVPDSPPARLLQAVMAQVAFREARVEVMRLLALVVVSNADLERWETEDETSIDSRLDEEGTRLVHAAQMDELMSLAAVTVEVAREQLRDPFDSISTSLRRLREQRETEEKTPAPTAGPMKIETETETDQPAEPDSEPGSTSSPADTTGTDERSSTEPRSDSPTSFVPG